MNFEGISSIGWVVLGTVGILALMVVFLIVRSLLMLIRKSGINTPFFSLEQAETRGAHEKIIIMNNQMNNALNLLGALKVLIRSTARDVFQLDPREDTIIYMVVELIIEKIRSNVRVDFEFNHITEKNVAELKEYARAKSEGYYNKIITFFDDYNWVVADYDLKDIQTKLDREQIGGIFMRIYSGAKMIGGQRKLERENRQK